MILTNRAKNKLYHRVAYLVVDFITQFYCNNVTSYSSRTVKAVIKCASCV